MTVKLQAGIERAMASGETKRLLLHCCCAPCASYVLEYLSPFFSITMLFYNPNIWPREEYDKRAGELQKLLIPHQDIADLIVSDYDTAAFEAAAMPYRDEPEGGARCRRCFELRLAETASYAKSGGFSYFATTLTVSPHKDASAINDIGGAMAERCGATYLSSDFKKRDGFKRSIELSKKYGLYRQSYCGCSFTQNSENNMQRM